MKKGVFITSNDVVRQEHDHPWAPKERIFNNRNIDFPFGNGMLTVSKRFTPKYNVRSALLRITSLGIFEALLNGKRIGRDGVYDELTPLWTDYNHRVFEYEYDLMPYLKKNRENVFGVRVSPGWWSGRISCGIYGFKQTALCAEIELTYKDGSTEIIASGEDWDVAVAGPVMSADIWNGECFDARIPDPAAQPDSIEWKKAVPFTDYTCDIVPFEGEYVRVNEYLAPVSATVWRSVISNGSTFGKIRPTKKLIGDNCEKMKLKAGQHLTLDFGQNMVGRPAIAVMANNGTKIQCLFAEMLNDSGEAERGNDGPAGSIYMTNYRSALARMNYIAAASGCRKQLNIFRPLHTFYGFRYIELTADRDVEIECITGEVVGSALEGLGTFECSNTEVNKLYSNIEWGMKGNYLSVPTDCPQRDERVGWTGDTQIFCGAASYIADTCAFLRKWLGDARDSQKGYDGAYSDMIPRVLDPKKIEFSNQNNAGWADAGIIVPYRLWEMYGDYEVLEEHYDSMEAYMAGLAKLEPRGPVPCYGDWLGYEYTSVEYMALCYYAYDASLMAKISKILGKTDRVDHYEKLYDDILKEFHDKFISNGEIVQKRQTQTACLIPLAFDMFDGELYENTVKLLEKKIIENDYTLKTGFVGTGLLNQTLAKVGLNNLAYSLLLQTKDPSWLYSVRQGATTVWERWNSYTKKSGFGQKVSMNSFNHYAYGAVAEWLYSTVAGIRPDAEAPGFNSSFILAPQPDTRTDAEIPEGQERITMASATYRGIASRWEYENGRFVWSFTIPDGTAKIEFPLLYGQKTVELNGITFTAKELKGEISNGKMRFSLPAGRYIIK